MRLNKMKKNFSLIFKNIWFGIKVNYNASKYLFIMKSINLFLTVSISFVILWLWKNIINIIANYNNQNINLFIIISIYIFLSFIDKFLFKFNSYINERYSDAITLHLDVIMMTKTSRMDLSFWDSSSMRDKIRIARKNYNVMSNMTWLVFDILSEIVEVIVSFIIICLFNFWIGLITIILLIPYMIYNKKYTKKKLYIERDQIHDKRKLEYFFNVFFDINNQFEIKLNNIGKYFINKYKSIWFKLYKFNKKEDIKNNLIKAFILIINVSSELFIMIISIFKVIKGNIGIGDIHYNMIIVSRLRNQTEKFINDLNELMVNNTRIDELREFINMKPEIEKSGNLIPTKNPKIEFCNVSFHYPNSSDYILKNCSFTIFPKEKIGLIGLNGSGKSTILKLIFRFYDPNYGIIKLDNIDIKKYDSYKVRNIFSVLFQEYVTYCLPLREIIALSEFSQVNNNIQLEKACKISGFSNIVTNWEQGFDSILGRFYSDNGKDLSNGQWQILGLTRTYFKDSNYIILDEPSASLDPISEDKIFKQMYELHKNKNTITISHRLSNTICADKILVLNDGHIIEQGSHQELIKLNGKYSYLFNLQASKYK